MNSPSAASSTAPARTYAAATLFLVPGTMDRLAEGRRLASPLLNAAATDADLVARGGHPDILELQPPEKKQRIGIDQVREVIRQAQFTPVQSARKVCLIPRAEALTPEAANALLKLMEEPPRDLAFVVLAEHPSELLPTIVSRCRLVRVPAKPVGASVARLVEAGHSEQDAEWLGHGPLRDGDVDRLLDVGGNIASNREAARAELSDAGILDVLPAALGDEPIRRHVALERLIDRIDAGDPPTLTVGVHALAQQTREALSQFLRELLIVCFARARTGIEPGTRNVRLRRLCHAIDSAHRALSVYSPPEAVLLGMMLPGEEASGGN